MPHNILQSKLNTECSMMKFDKHTLGKRFSKFLSKMFWHFNHAVPNYSSINRHRTTSVDNSHHRRQSGSDRSLSSTRYRKRSACQRKSTLTSIQEENEIEL